MSQAGVFVYMSLSLCTTQDNMNWMHALKKAMQWSSGEKNHSRWWMNKTTHDIYYWKVLIVFTCTVFVDWKSSSRGSCRGHGEKFLLHTAVLSFTHPYVPYSSIQHFCKIIRSPSYSNYNRPICEEVMVKSRNITSDLIIMERRSSEAWQLQTTVQPFSVYDVILKSTMSDLTFDPHL